MDSMGRVSYMPSNAWAHTARSPLVWLSNNFNLVMVLKVGNVMRGKKMFHKKF